MSEDHDERAAMKAQRRRNLWLALILFGLVALIGGVTIVRLGAEAARPDGGFFWTLD